MVQQMQTLGSKLRSAKGAKKTQTKVEIGEAVEHHRKSIAKHRQKIKSMRRTVIDSL